jgi:hypothetical protein
MGRRIAVAGALLLALLGAPRRSEAGLLEIIWGMTGPQMVGASYGCLFELRGFRVDQCRVGGTPFRRSEDPLHGRWFVGIGLAGLFSTTKDSETQKYGWGEIWMVGADTGLLYRSFDYEAPDGLAKNPDEKVVQIHHGFGITVNRLFGRKIGPFTNVGIVIVPIDVRVRRLSFGVRLRLYPDGFTDDQFKRGLPTFVGDRPFEATIGFAGSYVFDRKRK